MIRLVLACVVPAAVAVSAAVLVGPNSVGFRRGEPMLVASDQAMAAVHAVDHAGCAPKLLTGMEAAAAEAQPAAIRIVKLDGEMNQVEVTELPFDSPGGTDVVLVLDEHGRLLAAGDRPTAAAAAPECLPTPVAGKEPGII